MKKAVMAVLCFGLLAALAAELEFVVLIVVPVVAVALALAAAVGLLLRIRWFSRLRRYRARIACTAFLLPFLALGIVTVPAIAFLFQYTVVSGRFLHNEAIVVGGALDQSGLTKVVVVLFYNFWFIVSVLAVRRMWLRGLPRFLLRVLHAAVAVALVMQIGVLFAYHWDLIRYVAAMGFTVNRLVGLIGGGGLFVGTVALLAQSVCGIWRPGALLGSSVEAGLRRRLRVLGLAAHVE